MFGFHFLPFVILWGFWLFAISFENTKWIMISLRIILFRFKTVVISYIDLRSSLNPPLIGHSYNVIVWLSSPFANFSSCFSFKFTRQTNVNFPIGFGRQARRPFLSKILHLSHRQGHFPTIGIQCLTKVGYSCILS